MSKVSDKQKAVNKELRRVYKQIELERGKYCVGCGRSYLSVPLSHSHIIPRSRRRDLITDERNIQYLCLSIGERKGCHDIWETKSERNKLLCYHSNLEYILEVDTEYYFLISE